jgi:hypothetical protein
MATTTVSPTITDDLNPPPAPSRVFYSLGRMLGVDDFQADQDYHRGCLARALLQLCGTGTVSGLNVIVAGIWQPNIFYPAMAFVFDADQNVQVNTGVAGTSGPTAPTFATAPGGIVAEAGTGIVWTNQGQINANGWRPNAPFPVPSAIIDSNNNVQILNGPPVWQPATSFAQWDFIYDANDNVQVNTGATGVSGSAQPDFATTPGGTITDGTSIVWTCEGPVNTKGWSPNTPFTAPTAIVDSNLNVQILTATSPFTSGSTSPVWNPVVGGTTLDGSPAVPAWTCAGPAQNVQILESGTSVFTAGPLSPVWSTAIGSTTLDGSPPVQAWTCVGPSQSEVQVTAGLAIDRVGRMIEVPSTVCIRMALWLAGQASADLNNAILAGNLWVDVFATFAPCTQGVTPCFASQDDYDATDAFSANRLLDSFAMQLVLRTDASSFTSGGSLPVPQDPWFPPAPPSGGIAGALAAIQQSILTANTGPAAYLPFTSGGPVPPEIPGGVDPSSVFLARISMPATAGVGGQPPAYNLTGIQVANNLRLFVYPLSLVARSLGFTSGAESAQI